MENLEYSHSAGAILFSLLLLVVVYWIAKKKGFFHLPPASKKCPVSLLQASWAFLIYLLFAYLILPFFQLFLAYWLKGSVTGTQNLSPELMGWLNFAALFILLLIFVGYCLLIRTETRRYIFWGEGDRTLSRFFRGIGMGIVGWIVSYPFVLFIGVLASLVAFGIWGEIKVEQVAVKQLKMTMSHPALFGMMIFAIIVIVPFMEELLFRGFLQNLLKRYFGRTWAICLTAVIFALVHYAPSQKEGNFQLIITLAVLSFFLGFLYEKERTLWACFGLHMMFNSFSVVLITLSSIR